MVLKWFTNYLLDRQQRVREGNRVISQSACSWGVPQGSVLGSHLFMLYMQNLPTWVNVKVILPGGFSIPKTACGLTNVVTSLDSWTTISGLQMNTAKHRQLMIFVLLRGVKCPPDTVVLCISRSLQLVTSYKYLGVILDHHLNWEARILNITKKIFQTIGDLLRAGHQLTSTKRKFFVAVIAADLGCGSNAACSSLSSASKGKLFQKRGIRTFLGAPPWSPSHPLYEQIQIYTLPQRLDYKLLVFIYRLMQSLSHKDSLNK